MRSRMASGLFASMKKKSPVAVGADSGSSPWLTAWAARTMELCPAWRKISVNRTTGNRPGHDQVGQYRAGADGWQLVHVADHHQARPRRHRPQQLIHQHHVNHDVSSTTRRSRSSGWSRSRRKPAQAGIEFKQSVNCSGVAPGGFAQALGRPPGRGTQPDAHPFRGKDFEDAADQGRLPDTRPPVMTRTFSDVADVIAARWVSANVSFIFVRPRFRAAPASIRGSGCAPA